jgi:hypothetical protein
MLEEGLKYQDIFIIHQKGKNQVLRLHKIHTPQGGYKMWKRSLQTALVASIVLMINTLISAEEKYLQNDYQKVTITRNVSQGTAESFEIKQVDYLTPDPDYTFTLNKSPIWNAILFYPDYSANPDTMAPVSIWPDSLNSTNVDSFPWGGGAQQSQDSLWFQWKGIHLKEQDEHLSGKMDVTCSVAFRNGDRKAHWHVNLQRIKDSCGEKPPHNPGLN